MVQSNGANNRGLIVLLFFIFFMVLGYEMIMPLIIIHYVNNLGFSATAVAFALATRQFSQQGLAMLGGTLADRIDVRILISSGVLLRTISFVSLAFASNFPLLLVSMILAGLGGVLFETPYQTAIAILTTKENRPRYYALSHTIIGIASIIGPLLGVLLLHFDFKVVCFGAAFCFMICFIISRFFMPSIIRSEPSYTVGSAFKTVAKDRSFLVFVFIMVLFWLAISQINITFPLRIQELSGSATSVGVMWALYAAVIVVLQYPLVSLMLHKYSPRQIVAIGISIIASALLLISFVDTTNMFLITVVFFALGMLLARPNQQTVAVAMADPQAMGVYLGANSLAFAFGNGFGLITGGIFFDLAKETNLSLLPWFLYSAFAFASMLGFILHKKMDAHKKAK